MATRLFILSICLFLVPVTHTVADDPKEDLQRIWVFSARVQVAVSAEDEDSKIKSFLTRELRELQGVSVVDEDPMWTIQVVSLPAKSSNGLKLGVALSVIILRHQDLNARWQVVKDGTGLGDEKRREVMFGLEEYVQVVDHKLLLDESDSLRSMCETIVAAFDAERLEPVRQYRQKMEDIFKK